MESKVKLKKENKTKVQKIKKKRTPFNLKEWIKMVLEKSSSKRNKVPKIPSTFRVVLVQVTKGEGNKVIEKLNEFGAKICVSFFAQKGTKKELKLLSINEPEVELLLGLVPSENFDKEFCVKLSEQLIKQGIDEIETMILNPSSADLNLIYLLRGRR